MTNEFLIGNENIENAINQFSADNSKDNFIALCKVIRQRILNEGHILAPIEIAEDTKKTLDEKINTGDVAKVDGTINLALKKHKTENGKTVLCVFTSREQMSKGKTESVVSEAIKKFFNAVLQMKEINGIVINPYDKSFFISKDLIKTILEFK